MMFRNCKKSIYVCNGQRLKKGTFTMEYGLPMFFVIWKYLVVGWIQWLMFFDCSDCTILL